jgi:hypothetical protein
VRTVAYKPLVLGLLVAALAACQQTPEDNPPTPPDLAQVLQRFSQPTAPLNAQTALAAMQEAQETGKLIEDSGITIPIVAAITSLFGSDDQTQRLGSLPRSIGDLEVQGRAVTVGGSQFSGGGYMEVTRICGDATISVPDPSKGSVELTAIFDEAGFNPVLWGELLDCQYLAGQVPVLANAAFAILLGDGSPLGDLDPAGRMLTISVDGDLVTGGLSHLGNWAFRLLPDGGYELNLDLPEGNLVVFGGVTAGFRAANGLWTCNFESGKCLDEAGTLLSLW